MRRSFGFSTTAIARRNLWPDGAQGFSDQLRLAIQFHGGASSREELLTALQ